jgi:hypothetical protein
MALIALDKATQREDTQGSCHERRLTRHVGGDLSSLIFRGECWSFSEALPDERRPSQVVAKVVPVCVQHEAIRVRPDYVHTLFSGIGSGLHDVLEDWSVLHRHAREQRGERAGHDLAVGARHNRKLGGTLAHVQ